MNSIVGLTGEAGAGKDTVGKILVDRYGFTRVAFGDVLRNALLTVDPLVDIDDQGSVYYSSACAFYGEDFVKRELGGRRLLENLGDAIKGVSGEDAIVKAVERQITGPGRYVITDVRFGNEQQMIQARGGFVFRVVRPDNPHRSDSTHRSATGQPTGDSDIVNDDDLHNLIAEVDREMTRFGLVS